MAEELHVYLLFCTDRVVASSEAEAFEIWQALMGENPDDYDLEIERVPDDARWRITFEDESDAPDGLIDPKAKLSAAEWVKLCGKGFLCSTEW